MNKEVAVDSATRANNLLVYGSGKGEYGMDDRLSEGGVGRECDENTLQITCF